MQQSSSQQLKCYGRRNRSKPEPPSTLECGPPLGKKEDVGRAAAADSEETTPSAERKTEVLTHLKSSPQSGSRGRPRKVIGSLKQVERGPSHVAGKNMPTTRAKSAGKPLASEAREASRDVTPPLEDSSSPSEASTLKTPSGSPDRQEETVISLKSEGPLRNGGSEYGRRKSLASISAAGSQRTRSQIAKEEAQQASGGGQSDRVARAIKEKKSGGQVNHGRKDGGQVIAEKKSSGVGSSHLERKDVGHLSVRDRENAHATKQSSLAASRRYLALQKRQREDMVLLQADEIFRKQEFVEANKDKKGQPKSKEPARLKTHWDFVIEEMTWLAKDFERERKWKLNQAKKVAIRVSRSKLDVEARENRRLKEEELRVRRVASGIAKDVKKFWLKVDKLVSYKQQLLIEERKKKALDKHLDFLLGQTERYSTMLAENLADTTTGLESQNTLLLPPIPLNDSADIGQELVPFEAVSNIEGNQVSEVNAVMEFGGGDEDFMLEDEEEQEDDEATLEADEALITEEERKEELSALQRESELPIEELLRAYSSLRSSTDSEVEEAEDEEDEEADEEDVDEEEMFASDALDVDAWKDKPLIGPRRDEGPSTSKEIEDVAVLKGRRLGAPGSEKENGDIATVVPESLGALGGLELDVTGKVCINLQDEANLDIDKFLGPGKTKSSDVVGETASSSMSTAHEGSKDELAFEAGNATALVVELADGNPQSSGLPSFGGTLSERILQRQSRLRTGFLDLGMARELQDDSDYIPAALADGNDEDDERTLEEEERMANDEGAGTIDEIDQLKLESEMSIEELMAKYRSAASEVGEDFEEFSPDRRDRTSEAGTSGSSDEEDDDVEDEVARDVAEAKERMGEPSTSGRFHPSMALTENGKRKEKSQLIDSLEVKQEVVDAKLFGGGHENLQEMGRRLQEPKDPELVMKNHFLSGGSSRHALSATSLLLEVDGEDDAETAVAVAKVTAAAKQRRERVVIRSVKMRDILGNEAEDPARENLDNDVKISLPIAALEVVESGDDKLMNPSLDMVVYDTKPSNTDTPNLDLVDMDPLGITTSSVEDETMLTTPGDISNLMDKKQTASPVKEDITELVDDGSVELKHQEAGAGKSNEDKLADFAAAAQSAQPTGYTFSTTKVKTKLPFLLKHSLREYQHIGLDWLVTMYEKRLNGILADEMGLGKTIMTIALLAHLACEKGIWGPHLIVVPTSVMLNWETEFMKWCPAFKILTYFGNAKERKVKRQGWSRPNSFHVCITTYRLVIQDAKAFKRKKWKYLILDEAHLIKNWKSQRWQTLLNFNSKRRILLTGTPLQNDLMELWSLMHFLMPHVFQSHQEFRDWFSNPITGMVEGENQVNKELVDRLHNVLRPFLLRRLKKDVEKQLPGKFEHVIRCRLSKRQRNLYEDFMASSDTQATLSSGNFLGLINVLMQLRKVCNHPDLFEGRPIISSFDMPGIEVHFSTAACSAMSMGPFDGVNMEALNLLYMQQDESMTKWEGEEVAALKTPGSLIVELASTGEDTWKQTQSKHKPSKEVRSVIEEIQSVLQKKRERERKERVLAISSINELRCSQYPLYGADFVKCVEVMHPVYDVHKVKANPSNYLEFSSVIANIVQLPLTRFDNLMDLIAAFVFAIPAARAPLPVAWCSHLPHTSEVLKPSFTEEVLQEATAMLVPLRPVVVRRQLFFPDRRLLQFDCGKLQELAVLLRRLKSEGHRALIFTQMTKMLDVLESFINLYGYTYMRLDGSTKPEQRQILMQRFNTNPKIFLFILSTRSGGVGINLVGADTVIFYDSDWNPAMDQQAQDRCHRIGQTREVHIYRLISESTIEENILKKANQKRILDDLVIQSGSYNTEFFKKLDPMELFSGLKGVKVVGSSSKGSGITPVVSPADISGVSSVRITEQKELSNAEVEAALKNAEDEADYMAMKRVEQEEAAENQEFTEEVFAGNLDDEDLADDVDDVGRSGKSQTEGAGVTGLPKGDRVQEDSGIGVTPEDIPFGESSIIPADADEDMDMLADVRQMAAAAAASGRGSVSFEDQLRPIERYAMRFLELWDPRVDNLAVEAQVAFEEKEWELDQLEKLKEEQEAEIDEDNEPLYYETWDTALADEAYRQQVDILVQQQEQKQLEWEAMEEELRDADRAVAEAAAAVVGAENFTMKSKGKKKLKKAKFKSLAEGSLMSDTDDASLGEDYTLEGSNDPTYRDLHSDMLPLPHRSPSQRKRKAPKLLDEEMLVEMHTKKFKKDVSNKIKGFSAEKDKGKKKYLDGNSARTISGDASDDRWPGAVNEEGMVLPRSSGGPGGALSGGKNKAGGKITILGMHPKKGPLVMLEKERKKDFSRSQDHVPPASPWKHAEDAVLCAVVHEYGGNWQLASDALAGGPDGGVYRGRHRHPIHCRERFRQLLAQNAAAASGDPSSEKSALSAATNAQLKVTEEHTKRLLDAVLQHSDDELLLQRHFMAVLTASQNWKKQSSEKLPTTSEMQSPRIRSFVPLQNLVQPHPLLPSLGKRKVSPQEVIAALTQVDKEPKSASTQGLQRASSKEQASKDQSSKVDDEAFSVAQFLVGFSEVECEGASQDDGGVALQSHSLPSPMSLEAFLGISTTVPSPPPPHFAKAVRNLAEILVENRFRFATRIGWDGSAREWAAAGGSGTGVWGVHLPTKGKGVAKKRPAPDPSKPPKPKQPKTPKTSLKKDRSGEPSPTTVVSGEHTKGHVAQNGESCGTGTPSSELPGPSGSPGVGGPVMKISTSRPKKNPKHSAVPSPQSGTGQLDLNVQQPDVFLLEAGSKVINSKKVKKKAGGSSALGGSEISQRAEKKNSKATPPSANHLAVDSVPGAKMGVEYAGSHISAAQALSSASKWKGSPGRGFDLNGSSDEDLAVLGVSPASPGRRLHGSNPPMAVPIGRSELSRFISGADTLGSSKHSDEDRDGFNNLNYSGLSQRATANTQQAKSAQSPARLGPYSSPGSLASLRGDPKGSTHATPGNPGPVTSSHIMRRPDWQTLSASPAQEHLLASSFSKGLSQFHWPPAPGSWPLPLPNDLDSPADIMRFADSIDISPSELRAFPSLKGKHNAEGLPQFKSPVEQETGQSPGTLPSSLVSRLQTPEGRSWMANVRGDHILQHEILERQRHGGSNLHPQPQGLARAAGHSPPGGVDPLRQSLGYAPPGSLRSPFGSSSLPLQHSHSRPHVSPSRSMKAPPNLQPPSSPNPPMYNHPSFPGFTLQPFRSSESPAAVDTDLGLSLGSGVPKKQLGVNNSQDHQPHTSSS